VLFISPLRRRAADVARSLNEAIAERDGPSGSSLVNFRLLIEYDVPDWAHSVRVKREGLAQWAVVASDRQQT